jgi:opacity protein-like surface antigen
VVVFLGSAALAFGQVGEVSLSFGSSDMRNNLLGTIPLDAGTGIDISADSGFNFGARLTLNTYTFFGHEFGYVYNRGDLVYETVPPQEDNMTIHQGFYNFLAYATPEGSFIRPFATGGVHFNSFVPPGGSVYNAVTKFGVNYGGGVEVRITPVWGIRLDVRDYATGKPIDLPNQSGWLKQLAITGGVSLLF